MQDDFYLKLVDWTSQNMRVVGLGTCVYLWSASSSKVSKLCDLGLRESVCAVRALDTRRLLPRRWHRPWRCPGCMSHSKYI